MTERDSCRRHAIDRRRFGRTGAGVALALVLAPGRSGGVLAADGGWAEVRSGDVVLFRHAEAPGVGDPAGFRLGDCGTQRNLNEAGRRQARRIGEVFRSRGLAVGAVRSSRWCRARETAELAFPGQVAEASVFDSFFAGQGDEAAQTRDARALVVGWRGPGVLVVVTHQVNITALVGVYPASGEGIVLRPGADDPVVVARIRP